jgi:hypothetical protein
MQPASEAPLSDSDIEEQFGSYSDSDVESVPEEEESKLYVAVCSEESYGRNRTLFCRTFTSKWRAVRKLLQFVYMRHSLSYADLVTHFTRGEHTRDESNADKASIKAALKEYMKHLVEANISLSGIQKQLNAHFPERESRHDSIYGVAFVKIKTDESVDELDSNILM